jgi:hypothetical protein
MRMKKEVGEIKNGTKKNAWTFKEYAADWMRT